MNGVLREIPPKCAGCTAPATNAKPSAALLAAMPGIAIQNPTAPRFVGVLLEGEMPRPGDTLRIPDNSARIVACQNNLGAISLVLEGGESA